MDRAAIARETVAIVERGHYVAPSGRRVDIADPVRACVAATRLVLAGEPIESVAAAGGDPAQDPSRAGRIELTNESTLAAIVRALDEGAPAVSALNFASARNPGGGFLKGAHAQEESLARSSALHASLLAAGPFYEQHRASPSLLYSDAIIVSPGCPVFRDDAGTLLEAPRLATFLTSPAPNAGAIADRGSAEREQIAATLARRADRVVDVAAAAGPRTLILGAWGCGVFRNDPAGVASALLAALQNRAECFDRVIFAVLDHSPGRATFGAFRAAIGPGGPVSGPGGAAWPTSGR